jgi:hypothetical protein
MNKIIVNKSLIELNLKNDIGSFSKNILTFGIVSNIFAAENYYIPKLIIKNIAYKKFPNKKYVLLSDKENNIIEYGISSQDKTVVQTIIKYTVIIQIITFKNILSKFSGFCIDYFT